MGATEMSCFPTNITDCGELGTALYMERLRNNWNPRTLFWTTPNGGGTDQHMAYPFDFADYLP